MPPESSYFPENSLYYKKFNEYDTEAAEKSTWITRADLSNAVKRLYDDKKIRIFFDGGYRHRSKRSASAAYFSRELATVTRFTTTPASKCLTGQESANTTFHVHTNNSAELAAGIQSLEMAYGICDSFVRRYSLGELAQCKIECVGDSACIVGGIQSVLNDRSFLPTGSNDNLAGGYRRIQQIVETFSQIPITISMLLVPRIYNTQPDALCNDIMDEAVPRLVASLPLDDSLREPIDTQSLLHQATQRRGRSWQTLPPNCIPLWVSMIQGLELDFKDKDQSTVLALAPVIFLPRRHRRRNTKSQGASLLGLLHVLQAPTARKLFILAFGKGENTEDLSVRLAPADAKVTVDRHAQEESSNEHRMHGLLAQRTPGKADMLLDGSSKMCDPTSREIQAHLAETFDGTGSPPSPVSAPASTPIITASRGRLFSIVRRMAPGKAPGLSGWTKELLQPVLGAPSISGIPALLNSLIRNEITSELRRFLGTNIGHVFDKDVEKADGTTGRKRRALILGELLLKVAWRAALEKACLPKYTMSAQCLGRRGGPLRSIRTVQRWLSEGYGVIFVDAVNGFPSMSRAYVAECLENVAALHCLIPLFNLVYTQPTTIRMYEPEEGRQCFEHNTCKGLLVGCAAASPLFALGQSRRLGGMRDFLEQRFVAIVDDTAIRTVNPLRIPKSLDASPQAVQTIAELSDYFQAVAAHLKPAGVDIKGEKTRAVFPPNMQWPDQSVPVVQHTTYGGAIVGVAATDGPKEVRTVTRYVATIAKLMNTRLSLQDKYIMLRFKQNNLGYVFRATEPRFSTKWLPAVQKATANAIGKILDLQQLPSALWAQLHASISQAGGGLLSLEDLQILFEEGTERTTLEEQNDMELSHQPRIPKSVAAANARFEDQSSGRHKLAFQGADWRYSFLSAFPTMLAYTVTDGAFRRALRYLLGSPYDSDMLVCPEFFNSKAVQHHVLAPDHNRACPTCSAAMKHIRHEAALASWMKRTSLFGHPISKNVRSVLGECVRVGDKEYIPDAYYYTCDGNAGRVVFLDMRITHASMHPENNASNSHQLRASYTEKIVAYRPFTEDRRSSTAPDRELQPIIFSTHGVPSTKTAEYARAFGKGLRPGFAREAILTTGIKILETQHTALEQWYEGNRNALRQGPTQREEPESPQQRQTSTTTAAVAPSTPRQNPSQSTQQSGHADTPASRRRHRTICECNTPLNRRGECTNVVCPLLDKKSRTEKGSERRRRQLNEER